MAHRDPRDGRAPRPLDRPGREEILVGVAARACAGTVRHVVETVATALAEGFAGRRAAIVVVAGSRDAAAAAARRAQTGAVRLEVIEPAGGRGWGGWGGAAPDEDGALPVLLAAAERSGAACAVVDGGVRAITPEWVRLLLDPVVSGGLDLVAPLYARHRHDGLLTGHLVYPLTRALYGRRLRQPLGAHFGFSARLAGRLLASGAPAGAAGRRPDVWLVTAALAAGLPVGQAWLGPGRRGPRDSGADLMASFVPVVGTAFALMEEFAAAWMEAEAPSAVPTFGTPAAEEDAPLWVNVDRMAATFRQALAELMPVWRRMLAPDTGALLAALAEAPPDPPRVPAPLWARIVYDAAVAYHRRPLPPDQVVRALAPLYLGRAAAAVLAGGAASEADVEELCGAFESLKPYLLDRWRDRRP